MNWKIILAAGAILFSGTLYAQTPDGMVSYWKFDEGSGLTAFDVAGDNDGTLRSGPQWTVGKVVNALSFDGNNDYVFIPNSNSLNFTEAVTAEAWVKPNGNTGRYQYLLEKGTWAGNASWFFFTYRGAESYLRYTFGIGIPGGIYFESVTMIGNLEHGVWSHIVGTYDRQNIKFYVNGVLNNQVPWTEPIRLNSLNLYIGRDPQGHYNGDVDEVAIYNRALTACEIQQHYQNGLNGLGYFGDADCDGVLDDDDFCLDTVIPETVPTVRLNPNHWALIDNNSVFDTKGKGKGPNRSYIIEDTAGCSCEQIIEAQGLGLGHTYHGCSISAMDDWVEFVNQ